MLELYQKLGYVPVYCVWEITLRCNLSCRHCGSCAGKARENELTTTEGLALLDDLAELGCQQLTLSGGEPILRPDWPMLGQRAHERGLECGLISNGLAFGAEQARLAREAGLSVVGFSLDGLEATHDSIRRFRGSYQKVLEALAACAQEQVPTAIVTQITKRSLGELVALAQVGSEHGAAVWQVQLGTPMGNMQKNRDLCLEPADLRELLPLLAELGQAYQGRMRVDLGDNIGYYSPYEATLRQADRLPFWTGCLAGMRVLGVESDGGIKGCLTLPGDRFREGNLRETPLAELWRRENAFAFNRSFTPEMLGEGCRKCAYARVCRAGCRWAAFCFSGESFENPYCYQRLDGGK